MIQHFNVPQQLMHAISISCCLKLALLAPFCITKPRKTLEVDLTHVQTTGTAQLSYSLAIYSYVFKMSRPLRNVKSTINKPCAWRQVNRQILLQITWIFNQNLRLLVSALSKSISDKRATKKRKSLAKIVFLDVGTNVRHTFPSSELQCLPRGDPRNLCVNTRIRLLATLMRISLRFPRSKFENLMGYP